MGINKSQNGTCRRQLGNIFKSVLMDNPDITLTAEEFDEKYPVENKKEEKVNE